MGRYIYRPTATEYAITASAWGVFIAGAFGLVFGVLHIILPFLLIKSFLKSDSQVLKLIVFFCFVVVAIGETIRALQ